MNPSHGYDVIAQIRCPPLDERTVMQDEHPIDGAANTMIDGGVADDIVVRSCENYEYSVNYSNPLKCPICDEKHNISSLTNHLQEHRFSEPYVCKYCPSNHTFRTSYFLKNHLILHSGNPSYGCLECGRKVYTERIIVKHIFDVHVSHNIISNQNNEQENHKNAGRTSNTISKKIRPVSYPLGDIGNQDNRDNDSQPVLKWSAPSGSCPSTHPSEGYTEHPVQKLLTSSQNDAISQIHVETGITLPPEEAVACAQLLQEARIRCPPLDERTVMQDEHPIDGAANTMIDGAVGGVADDIVVRSYGNCEYSVNYSNPLKCPICDEKHNISSLTNHLQRHRFSEPYVCKYCRSNCTFSSCYLLQNHLILHSGNPSYVCLQCGRQVYTKRIIVIHIFNVHVRHGIASNANNEQENHKNAGRTSNTSSKKIRPVSYPLGDIGNQDNRDNDSQPVLQWSAPIGSCSSTHPSEEHTEHPVQTLSTSSQNDAISQIHVETGTTLPPEEAVACAQSLQEARMSRLPLDFRTRMQEERRIYGAAAKATYGGGVAEKNSENECAQICSYKDHLYLVDYRKMHKCPICYEMYSIEYFAMHLEEHSFKEPYVCEYCRCEYKLLHKFKYHLTKHAGNYSFKCLECGSEFSSNVGVTMHIVQVHERS